MSDYLSEKSEVDWSSPGQLITLLNMTVVGILALFAMLALESINIQNEVALGKLEALAVDTSDTDSVDVEQHARAKDITNSDTSSETQADASKSEDDSKSNGKVMTMLAEVDEKLKNMDLRQQVGADEQFLQRVLNEMKENKTQRTMLGIKVDKQLLRRMFGASMAVFYIVMKDTVDRILAKMQAVAPPGFPIIRIADPEEEIVQYQCRLPSGMEALFMAAAAVVDSALNTTCTYNISVSATEITDNVRTRDRLDAIQP